METPTRFDLDHAVTTWRRQLTAQPGLTPADVAELEMHLREAFAELHRGGLREAEAFLLARHRVGPPALIAEEFAKAEPMRYWRHCLVWAAGGALFANLWQSTLNAWTQTAGELFLNNLPGEIPAPWSWLLAVGLYLLFFGLPLFVLAKWVLRSRLFASVGHPSRWRLAAAGLLLIASVEGLQWWAVQLLNRSTQAGTQEVVTAAMGSDLGYSKGPLMTMLSGLHAGIDTGYGVAQTVQFFLNALWPFCLLALLVWLLPRRESATNTVVT